MVELRNKVISVPAGGGDLSFRVKRLGIGRVFYENILLALEKRKFAYPNKEQRKRVEDILETVFLSGKRNELAGEISYEQQKLLTIGCCIANNAEVLLIDKPVAGIGKNNRLKIITERQEEINKNGY